MFGLFLLFCGFVMAWNVISDPHYTTKMKELEED